MQPQHTLHSVHCRQPPGAQNAHGTHVGMTGRTGWTPLAGFLVEELRELTGVLSAALGAVSGVLGRRGGGALLWLQPGWSFDEVSLLKWELGMS